MLTDKPNTPLTPNPSVKLRALSPLTLNRLYVALPMSLGNMHLTPWIHMEPYKIR